MRRRRRAGSERQHEVQLVVGVCRAGVRYQRAALAAIVPQHRAVVLQQPQVDVGGEVVRVVPRQPPLAADERERLLNLRETGGHERRPVDGRRAWLARAGERELDAIPRSDESGKVCGHGLVPPPSTAARARRLVGVGGKTPPEGTRSRSGCADRLRVRAQGMAVHESFVHSRTRSFSGGMALRSQGPSSGCPELATQMKWSP